MILYKHFYVYLINNQTLFANWKAHGWLHLFVRSSWKPLKMKMKMYECETAVERKRKSTDPMRGQISLSLFLSNGRCFCCMEGQAYLICSFSFLACDNDEILLFPPSLPPTQWKNGGVLAGIWCIVDQGWKVSFSAKPGSVDSYWIIWLITYCLLEKDKLVRNCDLHFCEREIK